MVYLPFLSGIQRINKSLKRFSKFIVCYNKLSEYAQLVLGGKIELSCHWAVTTADWTIENIRSKNNSPLFVVFADRGLLSL